MASNRVEKFNQVMRARVAVAVEELTNADEVGFVTITDVETAPDMKHAVVWVSFIAPDPIKALELLDKSRWDIQQAVNKSFETKFVPQIKFRLDESEKQVEKINKILDGI